jgi:hypothetical protein
MELDVDRIEGVFSDATLHDDVAETRLCRLHAHNTVRRPSAQTMMLDRRPSDSRDALRPLGLHGMGLARLFTPFLASLFLCTPVSGCQPGLHLLQVLLLCGVGLLERLYEGVLTSLLG